MSAEQNNQYWSIRRLYSRGWTKEQIEGLLPPAYYRRFGANRVRCWKSQTVLRAEQSEDFGKSGIGTDTKQVTNLLHRRWAEASLPQEDAALLAQYYHNAICAQLQHQTKGIYLSTGKATGYLSEFLSLPRQSAGEGVCDGLRRFVLAGVWLGKNPYHSISGKVLEQYPEILFGIAKAAILAFQKNQPEANVKEFLSMKGFPIRELLSHTLVHIYSVIYIPTAIRENLQLLVALNPKDEYPAARAMRRHFFLHIGGTNTGKTYAGFQRLQKAPNGIYLAPLRLLAMEAQETLLHAGIACALSTGEEEDWAYGDTHICATAEKLDLQRNYAVAVIDECQMISDPQRGAAWTRAILGICAPEIHLCAAPQAKGLLVRLIESCGDTYQVIRHNRKTPLVCMDRAIDYDQLQPGDALITFSKIGVLSVAEDLRQRGMRPAIIYGALPYATRRRQMEGFLSGQMRYVVSTDAIGMGLNLPIARVIFMETEKYDGIERRPLKPEEVQQIAGRAGRFGMYDKGYVGAMEKLPEIRTALDSIVPPLTCAVTGFSDYVLEGPFDLLEVLEVWNKMPAPKPYQRLDVGRYLTIITRLREQGFHLTKAQELRAASIPFDETEDALNQLFYRLLQGWTLHVDPEQPTLLEREEHTLPELEPQCRRLDLYYSFCRSFDCPVDEEALYDQREALAEQINSILLHKLKDNIRFCRKCGAALPLHHQGALCGKCYRAAHYYRS